MRALLVAATAVTLVGGCATTSEPPYAPPPAADLNSPLAAPGYMRMAASSDLFEVESSRLALQMSQNPQVRQFAQMMINDHTRTSQEMAALAQSLGLAPPPRTMAPHHMEMLNRLRSAPAADFDRMYKSEQLAAHQEALNLHRNYADAGDIPELQAFAAQTAPVIDNHYRHARTLPETAYVPPQQPIRAGERG